MQSSAAVIFRALIMLGCLVAVPLAAVFGTSLSEVVQTVLAGQWPGQWPGQSDSTAENPQFEPLTSAEMASVSPPGPMPTAWYDNPLPVPSSSPVGRAASGRFPVTQAGYEEPVGPTVPVHAAEQIPVSVDRFTYIQDRLRQLGATYYVLETFDGRQGMYRFHCRMAVGGNSSYTRNYEALDSSPLGAMAKVLRQIEARIGPRR